MTKHNTHPFILALKARNLTVEIHHHSAFQIVLSNYTPFDSTIGGTLHERIHGFLTKPQVPHFCQAEEGTRNVLNIEPYPSVGLELAGRFKENQEYIVFDSPAETTAFFQMPEDSLAVDELVDALLSPLPPVACDEGLQEQWGISGPVTLSRT